MDLRNKGIYYYKSTMHLKVSCGSDSVKPLSFEYFLKKVFVKDIVQKRSESFWTLQTFKD